jgi:hypothetical protein
MKKAREIFEKHWTKATGKPLDETTEYHMKYAIEAINEALLLDTDSKQRELLIAFNAYQSGRVSKPNENDI